MVLAGVFNDPGTDPDNLMASLQAAAANYRIAHGPRAGQKVLSLQLAPRRLARGGESSVLCANAHGFSLHAGVRCAADDRQGLEQLCRYITRPAIANERLSVNRAGQVVLKLKTAWRDGTSHHVMTPLEFMQRLAALVPRPRLHLAGATSATAPDPLSWGAGTACDAAQGGGAGTDRDRSSARRRLRPHAGPPTSRKREGAHALGAVVEARVRCRHRAVPALWRATQAHRGYRRTCRDPAHPHPSWAGRAATPARTGRAG